MNTDPLTDPAFLRDLAKKHRPVSESTADRLESIAIALTELTTVLREEQTTRRWFEGQNQSLADRVRAAQSALAELTTELREAREQIRESELSWHKIARGYYDIATTAEEVVEAARHWDRVWKPSRSAANALADLKLHEALAAYDKNKEGK